MIFSQLTVNGLIAGSIYALVAAGFALIYATNRFMHFAHGASVMVGGYLLFTLFNVFHVNFTLSILLSLIIMGFFGFVMYRTVYLPLQKKKAANVILLIASIALLIFLQNGIQAIFGADLKTLNAFPIEKGMNILGATITPLQVVILIVALGFFGGLYWFMQKTQTGKHMRAVADNKELAKVVGINERRIADISFIIGTVIAGAAGVLIGLEQNLEPSMGTGLIIKGFTGAVIGGITSVPASVLGSYILGLAENYGIWFLPSGYKDAIAFILLFLFLLLKPKGLFGVREGNKYD